MPYSDYTNEEIAERGEAIYTRDIECTMTPADKGKMVVIDIETGEYEIDESDLAATKRILAKRPDAVTYGLRVGYPAAYHLLGWRSPRTMLG
jgi:hypothetical protein